jgi:hypothetical protein
MLSLFRSPIYTPPPKSFTGKAFNLHVEINKKAPKTEGFFKK